MTSYQCATRLPCNKGKLVGQKASRRVRDVWAIRARLQLQARVRDLALSNLGIDSKLRGCGLVALPVRDVRHEDAVASRRLVMQQRQGDPSSSSSPRKLVKLLLLGSPKHAWSATIFCSPAGAMN